jgi:outer membrane protein OmpA-like peptidoglycan-associated protein
MRRVLVGSIFVSLLVGCSTKVADSSLIKSAKKDYESIKNDTFIKENAPQESFQAGKFYSLLSSEKDPKKAEHLAYLLRAEVEVAKDSAKEIKLKQKLVELNDKKVKAIISKKDEELARLKKEKDRLSSLLDELNAKMTNRGLVLTLSDVLFERNKSRLLIGAMRKIDSLVAFLEENSQRKVLIEGHTDNSGSVTYNLDLSLRRSNAVAEILVAKGIDRGRIVTKGYGETYPITSNDTASGKQQNRRVEIIILNEGEEVNSVLR